MCYNCVESVLSASNPIDEVSVLILVVKVVESAFNPIAVTG